MTTAERYFSFLETQYVAEDGSRRQPASGSFVQNLREVHAEQAPRFNLSACLASTRRHLAVVAPYREKLMPIRYSKGLRTALMTAAKLQQLHGKRTEFLFETPAQQTRLQKAIRQLCRKEVLRLPKKTTLMAIAAAKANEVKKVSLDEL